MISIKLQDKAFGVPALAGILKVVIPDDDPEKLRLLPLNSIPQPPKSARRISGWCIFPA
jgi:hypothetical protein